MNDIIIAALRRLLNAVLAALRRPAPAPPPPAHERAEPAWLAHSSKELGVREVPGARSAPRILAYRTIAGCTLQGDDGAVPWCRIYVCAMFALCGIPYRKDWLARSVERDPDFVRLDGPALGAVCSFWRGSLGSGLGHTGFYRGEAGGRILVEGGNENDAVRRAFYPRSGRTMGLVGYYWPKGVALPRVGPIAVDDDGEPLASAA